MAIPNRRPDPEPAHRQGRPELAARPPDAPVKRSRTFPPLLGWLAAGLGIVVLVLALAGTWLIHSPAFHRYLLRTAQTEASSSLGVPVHLQEFDLHLLALKLDLYGITVEGAAPYAATPLLQLEHAEAGIRIVSLLGPKWYFSEIRVDHPVVQVFVDKNGRSNLPSFASSSQTGSQTTVFDLGIRHALLDGGEVFYNNRPAALAADLHDLSYQGSFDSRRRMYSGRLSYANGQLAYGGFRPLGHDFEAAFEATPDLFHLSEAKIRSESSSLALSGTLNGYASQIVDAKYDATVDGAQVGRILASPSMPRGLVRTQGTLHYQPFPQRPPLDGLKLEGSLVSSRLALRTASFAGVLENLVSHYSLEHGNASLRDLHAEVLGGQLQASGTADDLAGSARSRCSLALHGVSLAALRQALGRATTSPDLALNGTLDVNASAGWERSFDNLSARADTNLEGQVSKRSTSTPTASVAGGGAEPSVIPVSSTLHATYSERTGQATLVQSFLRTPQTRLTMNGTIGKRSSLALSLEANDLEEVATIADLFRTAAPGQPFEPLALAGKANFSGQVQGSTAAPVLTGRLTAANLRYNGTTWKTIRSEVELSPVRASLEHADLELATQGRIGLNMNAGLTAWSFQNTSPVQGDLTVSQIAVPDLEKMLGRSLPVTGLLNGNLHVQGSELNPEGGGTFSLTQGSAYEEPLESVKVNLSGRGEEARADLEIRLPAGNLEGRVSIRPREKTYDAQLTSNGLHLDQIHALKVRNLNADGVLSLKAAGHGSFDNPQVNATLEIPTLQVQGQTLSAIKLEANLEDHKADAQLSTSALSSSLQAKAHIDLTGDYMTDATVDSSKIPLQTLLAAYAPDQAANIAGQTELHATLHGPLKNRKLVEAHLTIPVLNAAYSNTIQLAAVSPIHVDWKDGVVNVQPASIRGTGTDLRFEGSIPTSGNGPMSLKLLGTVDLTLAQLFDPDVRSSGQIKFSINSSGAVQGASLGGEIDIVDANLAMRDTPVGLQHGNGVLTLTTDRVNVSKFEGTVGGGTVTAQGGVVYRPGLQFDVGLAAKGVRALYPQGVRETADAYLRLTGTTESALLGGTVNVSDLSFTPAFDLNSFIGQFTGGAIEAPAQGFSQNLALNIAVHSSSAVNLVSRTLSIGGSANLQVRGTAGDPVLLGRVTLSGGDIILNGTRFVLSGGTVQFINPSETQPVVNLNLTTTIQQYNIGLRFEGPASQLKTQYTSDPALPQADIINLLAFGQTTEAAAAAGATTTTNQTAESLVASQVSSQVTSRVSKVAGISQLSISPVLAGSSSQGPPGANLTIQQRVTGNLFVTFSTNVASTQSQTIQGQYQVSPRVAVSATRNPNGGFAVDTLVKKTW